MDYNLKTKEKYYSFISFVNGMYYGEGFFKDYDYDSGDDPDTPELFYKWLKKNHFLTTQQNFQLIGVLTRNDEDLSIESFEEFMIKDDCYGDNEIATLTQEEFYALYCWFLSENPILGENLVEDVTIQKNDLNWEYILNTLPMVEFPEIEIQDTDYIISSKDTESLKSGLESLEEICGDLDESTSKITLKIIKSMKKTLNSLES